MIMLTIFDKLLKVLFPDPLCQDYICYDMAKELNMLTLIVFTQVDHGPSSKT